MPKKIGVFCDINNQYYAALKTHAGARINYEMYLNRLSSDYEILRAFAYGAQMSNEATTFITVLKNLGFETKYRQAVTVGDRQDIRKTDHKLIMTCDIWRILDRIDVVVIGSNDPELIPLIQRIKELGYQVIVYSCNICRELKDVADDFIELDESFFEKRELVLTEA